MTKEELEKHIVEFGDFLRAYKKLIKVYDTGDVYSEGVTDAIVSINTLYRVIFKRTLEEEKES